MKTTVKLLSILTAIVALVILANATPPPISEPPQTKAAACITNCDVYSIAGPCLGSFTVTDSQHCTTQIAHDHWKGTCFLSDDCNNSGFAPLISATLATGCCGPETVGWVSVQCADGTSNWCLLVVPSGASGAIFALKGVCPHCGVTYCIKAYLQCGGQ